MSNQLNRVVIKKISFDSTSLGVSRQIEDPFKDFGEIIEPLYPPEQMIRLVEKSDILLQCVDAYKTNIVGFGVNFKYDIDFDKKDEKKQKELDTQWAKYDNFFKYCNFDESFPELMKKVVDDRERIGYACLEVIPDGLNHPAGFEHIPSHTVRICKNDNKLVEIEAIATDENGNEIPIKRRKKFKKFVQIQGIKKVYFKEFGDPRQLNCETGQYGDTVPEEKQATSIIFFNIYCPYSEYGLPRYMGQLLNISGSRKAKELNYNYFDEGRHIPLAIIVENGQLTEESFNNLKENKGQAANHKYLVLEAEGRDKSIIAGQEDDEKSVRIKFEKLAEILPEDALFLDYCKNNRDEIRSSFRLPPIYTGESQDYNRATADTARQIAEEQVFQAERESLACVFNNRIKPQLEIKDVSVFFKAPKIVDMAEVSRSLYPFISSGTATPNMLMDVLGELINKDIESYTEDWANKPLQLVLKEMELQKQQGQPINKSQNEILEALQALQATVEEALSNGQD